MALRVLLADDHDVVREGFRAVLEREGFKVVAEAADGHHAVHLATTERPDIAVLDISMPHLNGLDAGRQIIELCGSRPLVVLLTMHAEEHIIVAALRAGIRGYVVKTQGTSELVRALREVAAGGTYLSPSVCGMVVGRFLGGSESAADPLSAREREVLQLVAEGRTTKEIATLLEVSVKSAESYRTRLMDKLNIHDTATLVRYAIRHGVIEP
jgi:two-component system, NarL family, response regulator NreC